MQKLWWLRRAWIQYVSLSALVWTWTMSKRFFTNCSQLLIAVSVENAFLHFQKMLNFLFSSLAVRLTRIYDIYHDVDAITTTYTKRIVGFFVSFMCAGIIGSTALNAFSNIYVLNNPNPETFYLPFDMKIPYIQRNNFIGFMIMLMFQMLGGLSYNLAMTTSVTFFLTCSLYIRGCCKHFQMLVNDLEKVGIKIRTKHDVATFQRHLNELIGFHVKILRFDLMKFRFLCFAFLWNNLIFHTELLTSFRESSVEQYSPSWCAMLCSLQSHSFKLKRFCQFKYSSIHYTNFFWKKFFRPFRNLIPFSIWVSQFFAFLLDWHGLPCFVIMQQWLSMMSKIWVTLSMQRIGINIRRNLGNISFWLLHSHKDRDILPDTSSFDAL